MRNRITLLFAGACYLGVIGAASTSGAPRGAMEPPVLSEPDEEERQTSDATGCTCTDNNPCTTDECVACIFGICSGGCIHTPVPNFTPCNDSVFCNGSDFCIGGSCVGHSGDPCPVGDADCVGACNEVLDNCSAPEPIGSYCNDGVFCNGADTCLIGGCAFHAGNPCPGPDGDTDCSESCDEASDSCTANDADGTGCDDTLFCNGADTCSSGVCIHAGGPCPGLDADDDCSESCSEAFELCTAPDPNGSACDDGILCNGADACIEGSCEIHAGGNPCPPGHSCDLVTDSCACDSDINQNGVTDASDLALLLGGWGPCSAPLSAGQVDRDIPVLTDADELDATGPEQASAGPGEPCACDDGNDCTIDFCFLCIANTCLGCIHETTPFSSPCQDDDGLFCTIGTCSGATCMSSDEPACPPGYSCDEAADACIPCPSDLNSDGVTNASDLALLLGGWGPCE